MPTPNKLYVGEWLEDYFDQDVKDAILKHCNENRPTVDAINPSKDFMPTDEIQDHGTAYFSAVANAPIEIFEGAMPKDFYGIEIFFKIDFMDKDNRVIDRSICEELTKVESVCFIAHTAEYLHICQGGTIEWDLYIWDDLFRANIMNRFIDDGRTHRSDSLCAFPYQKVNRDFPRF